jgi:hypothetical protein
MATMPLGREIHSLKPFTPPSLDAGVIENMRAPPDRTDDYSGGGSSDEEGEAQAPAGAFPGTREDYTARSSHYY